MYYLYAEIHENNLDKSLMENIFVIFKDLYKGVFVPFAQLSTKVQSTREVSVSNKTFFSYLRPNSQNRQIGEKGQILLHSRRSEGIIDKRQCALAAGCLRPSMTLLRLPIHNYINSGESRLLAGKWVRLPSFLQSKDNYKQKSKQWDNEAAGVELQTNIRRYYVKSMQNKPVHYKLCVDVPILCPLSSWERP